MKSMVANGNITPSTFVIQDTGNAGYVLEAASATAQTFWGICHQNQWRPPWAPLQDGYAAIQGINIGVYQAGEICRLNIGGTVTTGDLLTSNGSGQGITTTTTGNWTGAVAMESGVSGDFIMVEVLPVGSQHP